MMTMIFYLERSVSREEHHCNISIAGIYKLTCELAGFRLNVQKASDGAEKN